RLSHLYIPFLFIPLHTQLPTSQLFPYTTLFRSQKSFILARNTSRIQLLLSLIVAAFTGLAIQPAHAAVVYSQDFKQRLHARAERLEEHTSELQSLTNLVCRLLLEKKKQETKQAS